MILCSLCSKHLLALRSFFLLNQSWIVVHWWHALLIKPLWILMIIFWLRYDRFMDAFEHVSQRIDDIYKVRTCSQCYNWFLSCYPFIYKHKLPSSLFNFVYVKLERVPLKNIFLCLCFLRNWPIIPVHKPSLVLKMPRYWICNDVLYLIFSSAFPCGFFSGFFE